MQPCFRNIKNTIKKYIKKYKNKHQQEKLEKKQTKNKIIGNRNQPNILKKNPYIISRVIKYPTFING